MSNSKPTPTPLLQGLQKLPDGQYGIKYSLAEQLGMSAVPFPIDGGAAAAGEGAAAAGEGAAAGAAADGAATTSSLEDLGTGAAIGTIWLWLTTPAHWLLILKYIGGAVLLFFGLRELVDGGSK